MNIALRIALSVLSAVVIVLVPMTFFSYRTTVQVIEKQLRTTRPVFAELVDTHIAGEMKHFELIARLTAKELSDDVSAGVDFRNKYYDLFHDILVEDNSVIGLSVALPPDGPSGRREAWYLYQTGENAISDWIDLAAPNAQPPYQERDWFVEPVRTGKPYWTVPYRGRSTGIPMITYSLPIFKTGGAAGATTGDAAAEKTVIGVLLCDISLRWLNDFIAHLELPRNAVQDIFVLAQDGMVIADRQGGWLYRNIFDVAGETNDTNLETIARRMIAGENGFMEYCDPEGRRAGLIVAVPIDAADGDADREWSLGLFVPQEAIKGFAWSVGFRQAMIGLGGFLVLLVSLLFVSRTISRPIRQLQEAALTIASGELDAKIPDIHGKDEISRLAESFARMQHDLKTHINSLAETTRKNERMASDLRIARRIQMSLVPQQPPPTSFAEQFDLSAFMQPAKDVGGDFYDYFLLDDETLCLVVADVSGKGVPASLLMTRGSAFFRTYVQATGRLGIALERVNRELVRDNDACMFITLFAALVNLRTGECHYANAGHNPPFLVQPGAPPRGLHEHAGLPLGIDEGRPYCEQEFRFQSGELLFLYSDGVTEAMNSGSELFGEGRTGAALVDADQKSCQGVIDHVLAAMKDFTGEAPQSDDITMVVFRYRG